MGHKQDFDEAETVLTFSPYKSALWVVWIFSFGTGFFLLLCIFAPMPAFARVFFALLSGLYAYLAYIQKIYTRVVVTLDTNGVMKSYPQKKKTAFLSWGEIKRVYFFLNYKSAGFVLFSKRILTNQEIKKICAQSHSIIAKSPVLCAEDCICFSCGLKWESSVRAAIPEHITIHNKGQFI